MKASSCSGRFCKIYDSSYLVTYKHPGYVHDFSANIALSENAYPNSCDGVRSMAAG